MSVGAPRGLASSGQKHLGDIVHPLSAAEEPLSPGPHVSLTAGPDVGVTLGGHKEAGLSNGTPVDTPSPASASSLFNRLQLDDDLESDPRDHYVSTETRDLFVTVDDPKKHVSTMETYITYRVSTMTTRMEFHLPDYCVRRRYQDFDWLRMKLEDSQPTHLIPPLPEKFVMKGVVDRFSEEFVETRMKALDKFLKRVADHPVLSFNPHLNAFLSAKDLNKRQGLALLTKVGESVKHVAAGYKLRARPPDFCAMGEYLDTFSQKLGTIDRIAQRILKEQSEYLTELREYSTMYSSWAGSEQELRGPLEGVASSVTTSCGAMDDLSENICQEILPVLREYILYIESMKNVLKKRDQSQAEYEGRLEAAILRKQEDKTPMPAEVERCQDKMECFNADLKADWERWQGNKRQDFKQLLSGIADRNVNYYEKCQTAWESLVDVLQDKQTEDQPSPVGQTD
ncbi:sorting nexin-30 [Nerophis ophidion]|uniref:sorting nexin-30 n=1 Tax=Nerophis ophidion TaxID=159077 RepID=UPI002AE00EE4|nr:sorting nexin-30 [Nerophis ophidion]